MSWYNPKDWVSGAYNGIKGLFDSPGDDQERQYEWDGDGHAGGQP